MQLIDLFIWLERSPVAVAIQNTTYLFPLLEVVHLLGLALLLGAILIVDLRLLGVPIQRQSASSLAAQINPFVSIGLAVMVLTGLPLLASEAVKCYDNPAFWWKMYFLLPAIVFHYTIRSRVSTSDRTGRGLAAVTGLLSLLLWAGVGMSGRAIAFV